MKLQVVIYLMYLLIITGFLCFFSPPYLFSKWTNVILQGNYTQEFFGRPDMAFSCKQKRNSNRFELSYRVSCQGRLITCYLFFQRLNWYFFNCFSVFLTSYISWQDFDIQCYDECVFFMFPIHVPVDEMLSFLYKLVSFPRAVGISSEQIWKLCLYGTSLILQMAVLLSQSWVVLLNFQLWRSFFFTSEIFSCRQRYKILFVTTLDDWVYGFYL